MKPFEDRRARIEAYKRQKQKDNSLETSEVSSKKNDIVSFEVKGKGKGEGKGEGKEDTSSPISSSSTAEAAEEKVLSSSFVPTWERYIDELKDDEQWMELVPCVRA